MHQFGKEILTKSFNKHISTYLSIKLIHQSAAPIPKTHIGHKSTKVKHGYTAMVEYVNNFHKKVLAERFE